SSARPGRGPPAATPPGAAARAVWDRISDMTGSPGCVLVSRWHVDLLLGARADFRLAPHMAGAGLVSAAASGSRARRAIPVSPWTALCRTASVTVVWPVRRL